MKNKVYLCGKMTGIKDFNYPLFNLTAKILRKQGYEVINPAELKPLGSEDWKGYMKAGIKELMTCDYIFTLDGWMFSKGARIEVLLAWILGIKRKSISEVLNDSFH